MYITKDRVKRHDPRGVQLKAKICDASGIKAFLIGLTYAEKWIPEGCDPNGVA
jgi:hypothetical protein